jgi:hypothetical protein
MYSLLTFRSVLVSTSLISALKVVTYFFLLIWDLICFCHHSYLHCIVKMFSWNLIQIDNWKVPFSYIIILKLYNPVMFPTYLPDSSWYKDIHMKTKIFFFSLSWLTLELMLSSERHTVLTIHRILKYYCAEDSKDTLTGVWKCFFFLVYTRIYGQSPPHPPHDWLLPNPQNKKHALHTKLLYLYPKPISLFIHFICLIC